MSDTQRQPGRIDREMPAKLTSAQPIPDSSGKEVVQAAGIGKSRSLAAKERQRALTARLMDQVCEPENLNRAYARVMANKGSPGVDGMTVGQLGGWIKQHKQTDLPHEWWARLVASVQGRLECFGADIA